MGQIIIPSDKEINGPWLLDREALDSLNNTLLEIEKKIDTAYNIAFEDKIKSTLEEGKRWDSRFDIEAATSLAKKSYPFSECDKYVLISDKQGKKIKDKDLISLLKDPQINDFSPIELIIYVRKGPCEFTLEIVTKYNDILRTRIKSEDDDIHNDINYEINKWIEAHKANVVVQKWNAWVPFPFVLFYLLFCCLFIVLVANILTGKTMSYSGELAKESYALLEKGITDKDMPRAIEILLQSETGYIPKTFKPDMTAINNTSYLFLLISALMTMLLVKPITVIGLGRNEWKVSYYRKWIYFVLIFIPTCILLPIILSKLS